MSLTSVTRYTSCKIYSLIHVIYVDIRKQYTYVDGYTSMDTNEFLTNILPYFQEIHIGKKLWLSIEKYLPVVSHPTENLNGYQHSVRLIICLIRLTDTYASIENLVI